MIAGLQPDGRVIDHHELRLLDQLIRTERLGRPHEDHVRLPVRAAGFHPGRHRLAAGLAHAQLIRVGTDHEQRLRVRTDDLQRHVQPIEHILKDRVGVRLAGVENHVGKDGHDLLESRRLLQKRLVQPLHVRPELDARHREIALETLRQVRIQPGVLLVVQLKLVRDGYRVGGRFALGEEGRRGLQPDFMRDHTDTALLGHVTRGRFGIELAVEHDHSPRLSPIEEVRKLSRDVPGRKDVFPQQIARVLVIVQMMDAQDPAQAGQTQRPERNPIPIRSASTPGPISLLPLSRRFHHAGNQTS